MGRPTKPALPDTETIRMPLDLLLPADYNPRRISDRAMKGLRASLERFGELGGIVYNKRTGRLVGGHQRVKVLAAMGVKDAEVRVVDLPIAEEKAANLALNHPGIGGEWDEALLAVVLDEVKRDLPTAFDELHLGDIVGDGLDAGLFDDGHGSDDGGSGQAASRNLADRFGVPPFSVLDARQGYWQDRKRAWLALGIQSELGRGGGLTLGAAPQVTEPGLNFYRNQKQGRAEPGGSKRPSMKLGTNGKTVRGDGRGRPVTPRGNAG